VLSIGAITLLFTLIRQGAAGKVASLFYLVPPVTALMAWFLFGETLGLFGILGMAVAAVGVALVNR
jgi:drug/metabolite transporter (DMT)-like permease